MHISPVDRRFDLAEADKLFNGAFHEEEDEIEEVELNARYKNSTLYMSREESFIGHKLESFESALTKIVAKSRFDQHNIKGDHIPKSLREELDLPDEMDGNEINYDEVRRKDCNVKRKTPQWSGQDVLNVGLTQD
jgi:hypothetical protein